jgi:hypothetical protein
LKSSNGALSNEARSASRKTIIWSIIRIFYAAKFL